MAISQVGTVQTFAFADGSTGHVCDFGSAPTAGQWDVLCVNSNTTVTTPAGLTRSTFRAANQGAYIFTRKAVGGEASTVTLTTTGNHNTEVTWSRWAGANVIDIATVTAGTDASAGSTTPAITTAALASTGELVIAFGAIHGAVTNTPVWSAGYTALAATTQGTGTTTATGYVATKANAGTAAESPNVSWTTPAPNRYMLVLSLTATAGGKTVVLGQATETDTAQTITRAKARTLGQPAEADASAAIGRAKSRTLGRSVETGTALALVTAVQPTVDITVNVGQPRRGWFASAPVSGWSVSPSARRWSAGKPTI